MKGSLLLESIRGKGTRAILNLPMKRIIKATALPERPSDAMSSHITFRSLQTITTLNTSGSSTPPPNHQPEPKANIPKRPIARRVQTSAVHGAGRRPSHFNDCQMPRTPEQLTASDLLPPEARGDITVLIVEDKYISHRSTTPPLQALTLPQPYQSANRSEDHSKARLRDEGRIEWPGGTRLSCSQRRHRLHLNGAC